MATSKRWLGIVGTLVLMLSSSGPAWATGLLVPSDTTVDPLGIVYQRINVTVHDQAAVTRLDQEFRNHTSRQLEAYYIFPLPKGAAVKDFAMWIGGRRVQGEMLEAARARQVYEDIVRRTKDPGLLEHIGENLMRVRVFPILPHATQRIEISYSEIANRDAGITQYIYPLKTCNQAVKTEQDFTVRLELNSTSSLKSVYSPTHDISVNRQGEQKAIIGFEAKNYPLDRDFQVFWTSSEKEVGLSLMTNRENPSDPGYFLMLISPRTELAADKRVPRDVVFVLDTSGSMKGEKFDQAIAGATFCLDSLDPKDRFSVLSFSTTVHEYARELKAASKENVGAAKDWLKKLESSGGTAIDEALKAALDLRTKDGRNFTVVFLTDGQPTIGETNPKTILANVKKQNTDDVHVFVFGVGDDVNAHLLDQIADATRSASTYVRPKENLEAKVSSFYKKISHPVLTNLELRVEGDGISVSDMYPPKLGDLFAGGQLVVLGRYNGDKHAGVRLKGKLGDESKEYVYESSFAAGTTYDFLPGMWARRKVGYLLDQIRLSGENKELVEEVVRLARRYGIVTPYTSYLVVPDEPTVARGGRRDYRLGEREGAGVQLEFFAQDGTSLSSSLARESRLGVPRASGGLGGVPAGEATRQRGLVRRGAAPASGPAQDSNEWKFETIEQTLAPNEMSDKLGVSAFGRGKQLSDQAAGAEAVSIAQAIASLKKTTDEASYAVKKAGASTFVNIQGIWVDRAYSKEKKLITVKYLSAAYFAILQQAAQAKSVFALGERVVWVTPSGQAIAIDLEGKEAIPDEEIRAWFNKDATK